MDQKSELEFYRMIRELCFRTMADTNELNPRPEIIISRLEQVTALAKSILEQPNA